MQKIVLLSFALIKLCMVLLLGATVIMVFGNAVLRYLFASGITVSEELSRWCFLWMIYLGGVLVLKDGRHLQVTMIRDALPEPMQRLLKVVVGVAMLGLCVMILKGSFTYMNLSWGSRAPASNFSMGWLYLSGVVFGALSLPITIYEIWLAAVGREPWPGYRSRTEVISD